MPKERDSRIKFKVSGYMKGDYYDCNMYGTAV